MQNTNAHIFSQGGKTYIANFLGLDIGQAVGWQFYDTADLPTDTDFDKTDFLNNLG
jgi:hypothetical protein